MQNEDEHGLLTQTLSGDHEAYRKLVDRYKNAIHHHCFAIVRDEDVAEDMAQETFISAYYKLALYNKDYNFSTWLFKIATNKCLNSLKKASKQVPASDELLASLISPHVGPAEDAAYQELHAAVGKLPARYRAVVSLYYWQGLSYQDIAVVLGVPVGSAKGWMRRAKDQLRKELS